jgi:nitrogen fixation NifU-like protein
MVVENGGMKVDDALELTPHNIMDRVGGLPSIKIHCSVLGDKALRAAINDYLKKTNQPDRVEEVKAKTICNCLNVTDKEIEELVLDGVEDFETLQEKTKISTGCGGCREEAEDVFNKCRNKYFVKDSS